MFVGEIGLPRREFLYDLTFCDILLISRGYFRRYHPAWEQARMIAHQVHYCMGVPKNESPKTPTQWIEFPWERDTEAAKPLSDEDRKQLQREMEAFDMSAIGAK